MAGGYSHFERKVGSEWDHHQGPLSKSFRVRKSICSSAGGNIIPIFGNRHKQELLDELMPVGLFLLFP